MALWKDIVSNPNPGEEAQRPAPAPASGAERPRPEPVAAPPSPGSKPRKELKESVIASGLTFEGKIEGSGHVRISGRFKGDVQVEGTLTIEAGAHLGGSVKAASVLVAGELDGNIEGAERVELQETAIVNGDISAGTVTVAAGARMRGRAEFGEASGQKPRS